MRPSLERACTLDAAGVFAAFETSPQGLTAGEAARRLAADGPNAIGERRVTPAGVLIRQLRNPLLLLLVVTAATSAALGERTDAYIIFAIIVLSVGLGFFNEYRSERAMLDLHNRVRHHASVVRDGTPFPIDVAALVPGDVVKLGVGDVVPADLRLFACANLECDQSVITGESLAASKSTALVAAGTPPAEAGCCALMGTTVQAGTGSGVVVATGRATIFGSIAAHLAEHPPQTAFQQGLAKFSALLVRVTVVLTASIFVVNAALHHPLLESLLFALAIAVGLTPQLLPAIVTLSLATGAKELAKRSVVVKRLVSIEDLGNVDVFFTDKTGTLTQGTLALRAAVDARGSEDAQVLRLGSLCTDDTLALDRALLEAGKARGMRDGAWQRIGEAPFDYDRKLMSVVVASAGGDRMLVAKGAPEAILERCAQVAPESKAALDALFDAGERVVAVATRAPFTGDFAGPQDERDLVLRGFLAFADPVKPGAQRSIERLQALGIDVRIVTGDNERVAQKVCRDLGMRIDGVLTGAAIGGLDDAQLKEALPKTTIFARVNPEQKSRIIACSRTMGNDVAFLGDGVNDAVALHYADVGISVDSATDVAKDAADIVLLDKDLDILADGVVEGRRIFANTIKYVLMGTSSNFGNMFSAAAASLFLPFLPMTAPQILLNNLLYDVGEMAIPTDRVDDEQLARPAHWDVSFVQRFMLLFGPISSVFDMLTFGVMLLVFHARPSLFQSGWFVESLLTQTLIIFVIRTRRIPFWRSRPSPALTLTSLAVCAAGAALPFTPVAGFMGFTPLPAAFFGILFAMIVAYLALVETAKAFFYRARPVPAPGPQQRERRRLLRLVSRWIAGPAPAGLHH